MATSFDYLSKDEISSTVREGGGQMPIVPNIQLHCLLLCINLFSFLT